MNFFVFFSQLAYLDDRTPRALLQIAFARAVAGNAKMAQREIVTQRILQMKLPQTARNI